MLRLEDYAAGLYREFAIFPRDLPPWELVAQLPGLLAGLGNPSGFRQPEPGVLVHAAATVETGAVVKPPALIAEGCFIAAFAYLRGGVALGRGVSVGPGCEVKASIVLSGTVLAHLNFVGDSVVGAGVNVEAGAMFANRWNERADKSIAVRGPDGPIATGAVKFGALVGDRCRIGANAVLSPGTVLPPGSIVRRLELVDQNAGVEPT